jgi:outer membrane protein assembly factor BamB
VAGVKRHGRDGAPPSTLIDLGAGPESAESAEAAVGRVRAPRGGASRLSGPSSRGSERVVRRSIAAAGLLALVGVGLPALLHGPTTGRDSGVLDPYPTAPGTTWEVTPHVAGRGTYFASDGAVFGGVRGDLGLWDSHDGSTALVALQTLNRTTDLAAVDVRDGTIAWRISADDGWAFRACSRTLLAGAMVCLSADDAGERVQLVAIRVSDRRTLARWDAPAWATVVSVSGEGVLLAGDRAEANALQVGRYDVWTGAQRWLRTIALSHDSIQSYTVTQGLGALSTPPTVPPTVVRVGGRVIVSLMGNVAIIDVATGSFEREVGAGTVTAFPAGGAFVSYQPREPTAAPVSPDVPSSDPEWTRGDLYPADGGAAVSVQLASGWYQAFATPATTSVFFLVTGTETVVCSLVDGSRLWSAGRTAETFEFVPEGVTAVGVLGFADVRVQDSSQRLQLRDLTTGKPLWTRPRESSQSMQTPVGWDETRIIVQGLDATNGSGDLEAIDAATGDLVWSIPLDQAESVASVGGRLVRVDQGRMRGLAPSVS